MNIPEIVNNIKLDLLKFADQNRKIMAFTNHPTSMEVFGLKVPNQRIVIEEWRKKLDYFTAHQWIELSIALVNEQILECQQVAFEFMWKTKNALAKLNKNQISELGKTLDNWVSVDMYCLCITGYCWRNGILSNSDIENWANDNDRWLKRCALVSTVPLNLRSRGGKGDTTRTLKICSMLINDHDDMVVKAMSWALRELSKSDREAVRFFVEEFKEDLHGRIKREVNTKLTTGKKNFKA